MKMLNADQMANMPVGTVYRFGVPYLFGELYVKGEDTDIGSGEWWAVSLLEPDIDSPDVLEDMRNNPSLDRLPNRCVQRDGPNRRYVYMVYDFVDLNAIIGQLQNSVLLLRRYACADCGQPFDKHTETSEAINLLKGCAGMKSRFKWPEAV